MIFLSIIILIVVMALPYFKDKFSPLLFTRISTIILIYASVLSFNTVYIQSIGSGIGIYSGLFHVSLISQIMDIFIFLIASIIISPWCISVIKSNMNNFSNKENSNLHLEDSSYLPSNSEYSLVVLFSLIGSSFLMCTGDLISMYLSIELQSFAVYILATIYRNNELSSNAGLKYFLLGGLSSCLILLGSGLIYSYTGLTNLDGIYSLVSVSNSTAITQGFTLGLVIIIIGFLFKIAAAPFHNWAPDVYNNVPSIVTTWLTIMPKIAILIFLLELQITTLPQLLIDSTSNLELTNLLSSDKLAVEDLLKNLLLISSLLSLIIGSIGGLVQLKIKRLLAYSTISHVGFLLLALSINSEQSVESFIFYIVQYTITNLNLFLILLAFGYMIYAPYAIFLDGTMKNLPFKKTDIDLISELKGQFIKNPILSLTFAVSLFSMAGIPPLIGFFAKQQVLYSATHNGYYFLSIVAIIVSVISGYYYLKIIRIIHFDSLINSHSLNLNSKELKVSDSLNSDVSNLKFISNENNNEIVAILENKIEEKKIINNDILQNSHSYMISILTLIILLFIFKPSLLLNSIHIMTLSLFYT